MPPEEIEIVEHSASKNSGINAICWQEDLRKLFNW